MEEEKGRTESHPFGYEQEIEDIVSAVNDFDRGILHHVALVADPYAGRTSLVQQLSDRFPGKVTYLSFNSVMTDSSFLSALHKTNPIVVMDNCHFLAMRTIGGFALLDLFVKFLSLSENLFITTWNTYAWSYLSAVKGIDAYFQKIVRLAPLDAGVLEKIILSPYTEEIEIIDDTEYEKRDIRLSEGCLRIKIPFSESPACFPYPSIKVRGLWRTAKRKEPKEVFFERLARISRGNPGVARHLWDKNIEFPTIWLSSIQEPDYDIHLSINESFILSIILSMESIQEGDLVRIAGPEIELDKVLYILSHADLIEKEKEFLRIKPEALKSVVQYLERIRMVW